MLETIHKFQIEFHYALKGAEQALFYPPKEVMEDIFKNLDTHDNNE